MQDQILIPPNFKTSKNSKSLTDPNQNQHALCLTRTLASAAWKVLQQHSAGLPGQTIELLNSNQKPGTVYHYKTGWRKWSSWCLSRNTDLVCAGVNFVLKF